MKNYFIHTLILFLGLNCVLQAQKLGRTIVPLNSNWNFTKAPKNGNEKEFNWSKVTIPHTWNDKDMSKGKDFYEGEAYYKKTLFAPKDWKNKKVFIKFEGVGQVARLYVNNRFVGEHKGSYAAFVFDVSYDLKLGEENKILVKVNNTARKDIIPVNHFLFGIYGGIYRPVSLIITDKLHISTTDYASPGVYIKQKNVSVKKVDLEIEVKLENGYEISKSITFNTSIYNQKGEKVISRNSKIKASPQGRKSVFQMIPFSNPHLWQGKNDPYLYKVEVSLLDPEGKVIDAVTQPLGVRKFEIISGKGFLLNGKKYPMYGVCRHQDWLGSGNALQNWQHDKDLEIIDEMGATTIRFAHYQQSEYLYSQCDSKGFVIWVEIPFVNKISGEEAANAKLQMEELVKQNFNHPSIYTWGLHNEVYTKTPADYGAVLTRDLNEIAKKIDPDRYTVSVNGYGHLDHPINMNADIQGINRYYGWYEGKTEDLKPWVDGLKKEYPKYDVILAEYGAGGNMEHQVEIAPKSVPYNSQFFPEVYETRFHEIQWGIIEKQDYLVASYIWNMFDFGLPLWSRGGVPARNHKGLVGFDRKQKKDAFYWYKANWNPEPMVFISGKKAVKRTNKITDIHVYCNTNNVELRVNGRKQANMIKGETRVHYIFKDVKLKKGKNTITARAGSNKNLKDTVKWMLIK